MKTKSLVRAIEKAGFQIEQSGNVYCIQGDAYVGEFHDQAGIAVAVSSRRKSEQPDSRTDYNPNVFHKTIKDFIARIQQTERIPAPDLVRGVCKWWNDDKGYGFLSVNDVDVFAHYTAIRGEGFKTLSEGEVVACELTDGPKGPQAIFISRFSSESEVDRFLEVKE